MCIYRLLYLVVRSGVRTVEALASVLAAHCLGSVMLSVDQRVTSDCDSICRDLSRAKVSAYSGGLADRQAEELQLRS